MWKFILPIVLFGALVVLFAVGLSPSRDIHELPSPLLGKTAPEFSLTDLFSADKTVSNGSLKGQVYVLNVWATWCLPCRQEHEEMLAISKSKEVPIVGLNYKDDRARAQLWLKQLGNPYSMVAFDDQGRAAIDWGVYGAPETYLVDGRGQILFKYISPMTPEVWEREFLPRIAAARKGGA